MEFHTTSASNWRTFIRHIIASIFFHSQIPHLYELDGKCIQGKQEGARADEPSSPVFLSILCQHRLSKCEEMKCEYPVDLVTIQVQEMERLKMILRQRLIDGCQWAVTTEINQRILHSMKTCFSFDEAVEVASKAKECSSVRIDTIKYLLKILNRLPHRLYDVPGVLQFCQVVREYPSLTIPERSISSHPFLLDDHFPVIHRQAISFIDPPAKIWLVNLRENQRLDRSMITREGNRCRTLIDGLQQLEAIASGQVERREGQSTVLVAETATGALMKAPIILYEIPPHDQGQARVQLPIIQLVDPTEKYLEKMLLFCKYARQEKKLTFFNGQLKRTNFSGAIPLKGVEFWSPRPLFIKAK